MNNIQSGIIHNEWMKVVASGINLFGLIFVVIAAVISFRAQHRSYVYATQNISV